MRIHYTRAILLTASLTCISPNLTASQQDQEAPDMPLTMTVYPSYSSQPNEDSIAGRLHEVLYHEPDTYRQAFKKRCLRNAGLSTLLTATATTITTLRLTGVWETSDDLGDFYNKSTTAILGTIAGLGLLSTTYWLRLYCAARN